ncbi:hypothetical protein GCM10010985_21170 [Caballeronia grimmiae]|uniref:Uncharacterized protein n=1 Tax=Caballeronia grimmiae TaxID=1071679 RepID=A0ABQ1RDB4_9BURK|nr:hypothetical protein GCM10010985_21170 [Caballeronia grimmiae]
MLLLADLESIQVERRAVDDLSGAARGLDSDIEHRLHERNPLTAACVAMARAMKLATTTMSTKDELNKSGALADHYAVTARTEHFTRSRMFPIAASGGRASG